MSKLLVFPGKQLHDFFYKDGEYFYLDGQGFWFYNEAAAKRECLSINECEIDFSLVDISTREKIYWWSPTWTRWVPDAFNYENARTEAFHLILKLKSCFKKYKIKTALFHTGVPHHIDTSLLTIACSDLGIPQIFLYAIVLDCRLLPLIQEKTIFDRKPVGVNVSNIKYENCTYDFLQNRISGNVPKRTTEVSTLKTNYYYAFFKIALMYFKKSLRSYILPNMNDISWLHFFKEISFLDAIKIVKKQREYVASYKKAKLNLHDSLQFINSNEAKIIIAAHYQPEATTFPEGGEYTNHIEIIHKLRSLGYKGKLGYKEHPATAMYVDEIVGLTRVGVYRSNSYLDMLIDLNCVILNETAALTLSDKTIFRYLPVTITGTIALERSLAGLHTIVTGQSWYNGMPGLIHISELKSLDNLEDKWMIPDTELAEAAKDFLCRRLNNKTLINVPGIGSGIPLTGAEEIAIFQKEITSLLNSIA
jgi:hypothetical protein